MAKQQRPEEIIGEWGVRDVTPPSQVERARLDVDRETNPLIGKPLRRRLRNFTAGSDTYLAALGGPLPYMQRLRQIEDLIAAHEARLAQAHAETEPGAWESVAARWDFGDVNDLIERHNRWYPVEARLAMDPRTRDYVKVGGRPYRREPLDAEWVLERFPAAS